MSTIETSSGGSRAAALVVYESMFGNTKAVAEAVALGLSSAFDVDIVECSHAASHLPERLALLVVGAPTHALGLSRESTREDARKQAADTDHPSTSGVREWLDALARATGGPTPVAATFDTKMNHPRLPGSAAHAAARRLKRLGYAQLVKPQTFYVEGSRGPLVEGTSDAAFEWAHELSTKAQALTGRLHGA